MAYEFQKLSEVEALSEVPEGARVLVEVNGDIKRVPGAGLGGNGGKTLIIDFIAPKDDSSYPIITANMTFEELNESFLNRELIGVWCYVTFNEGSSMITLCLDDVSGEFGQSCFDAYTTDGGLNIFFTPDGISVESPSSGGGSVDPK